MESDVESSFIILNHTSGETVGFPLVLLEGCMNKSARSRAIFNPESERDDESRATKMRILERAGTDGEILVGRQDDLLRSWPIVDGGFKALVPLNVGENIIKLSLPTTEGAANDASKFVLHYEPLPLTRYVRVVYIKCSDGDGTFEAPPGVKNDTEAALKKLSFNARLLQTFMAESLYQHGLGHHTFRLEEDEAGNPKVHVFDSKLTMSEALKMNGDQLYRAFLIELQASSLYDPMCKLWSFMSCTRYIPPSPATFSTKDVPKYVKAHTALGGGNLALFGTGGLHTWASSLEELVPCFCNTSLIDKMQLFDDSGGRGTFWANYATGLGASMHELGHCFDLAHTPEGIMARGFDDMNCAFTVWKRPRTCTANQANSSITSTEADKNREEPSCTSPESQEQPSDFPQTGTAVAAPSVASQPSIQACTPMASLLAIPQSSPLDNPESSVQLSRPGNWSHGARWHRSSAVLLRYHKWLTSTETSQATTNHTMVHWSRDTCGPVGSCFSSHEDASSSLFDSAKWLDQNEARLGGFIIHADEYVNCLQIVGYVTTGGENGECKEVVSEPQGTPDVGQRYAFTFIDPDEQLLSVDVRAGAWIDAVRFHTNKKSSVWMGGLGGNLHELKAPPGREIRGLFGTSGTYVTSLGALLHSDSHANPMEVADEGCLTVEAPLGIRLIELHDKKHGEVERHWEFLSHELPRIFTIPRAEVVDRGCTIQVEDDQGNMFRSATCPACYSQVLG